MVEQYWPPNADGIRALRVAIAVTGTRLPSLAVPDGMKLKIKALITNPGWLQVGENQGTCINVNQSEPLVPGEFTLYAVKNADQIYVAATAAGCFAVICTEQRRGGEE